MTINPFDSFIKLVRIGIGASKDVTIPNGLDWATLKALADAQGLSAVVLDAIDKLPTDATETMPQIMRLEWIGEVMQNYEARYLAYEKAIGSLAGFYNRHGFKMMVLKGYACCLDWPKPEHRPCGDIDIWQFGQQKVADAALVEELGIVIDNSHHHHTVFLWDDFMVENHYDFVNVHSRRSSAEMEKVFKSLGKDDSHSVDVCGERVYLPSPNLHALFLVKHLASHFTGANITLRQVLDWAFFVEKHGKEVNWKWIDGQIEYFGMKTIYGIFNAICVEDLGFNPKMFSYVGFYPDLKERVFNDIFSPEFQGKTPKGLLRRICFKYHRWKANEWKHKLCYKESMWSAFWSGIWSHLLKPGSI